MSEQVHSLRINTMWIDCCCVYADKNKRKQTTFFQMGSRLQLAHVAVLAERIIGAPRNTIANFEAFFNILGTKIKTTEQQSGTWKRPATSHPLVSIDRPVAGCAKTRDKLCVLVYHGAVLWWSVPRPAGLWPRNTVVSLHKQKHTYTGYNWCWMYRASM